MISKTHLVMIGALGAGLAGLLAIPARTPATLQQPVTIERRMETPKTSKALLAPPDDLIQPLTPEMKEALGRMFDEETPSTLLGEQETVEEKKRRLAREVEQRATSGCLSPAPLGEVNLRKLLQPEPFERMEISAPFGGHGKITLEQLVGNLHGDHVGESTGFGQLHIQPK